MADCTLGASVDIYQGRCALLNCFADKAHVIVCDFMYGTVVEIFGA